MSAEHSVTDAVLGKHLRAYKKEIGSKPLYVPLEEVERMMREVESAAATLLAEKIKARLESGKSYHLAEDIQSILEGSTDGQA